MRQQCIQTVEAITGRKVASFISGVDLHSEMSAEMFLLEPALVLPDEPVTPQDQHAQLR